jgi:hypothetical protein
MAARRALGFRLQERVTQSIQRIKPMFGRVSQHLGYQVNEEPVVFLGRIVGFVAHNPARGKLWMTWAVSAAPTITMPLRTRSFEMFQIDMTPPQKKSTKKYITLFVNRIVSSAYPRRSTGFSAVWLIMILPVHDHRDNCANGPLTYQMMRVSAAAAATRTVFSPWVGGGAMAVIFLAPSIYIPSLSSFYDATGRLDFRHGDDRTSQYNNVRRRDSQTNTDPDVPRQCQQLFQIRAIDSLRAWCQSPSKPLPSSLCVY